MPRVDEKNETVRHDRHTAAVAATALLVTLWVGIPWVASVAAAAPLLWRVHRRGEPLRPGLVWRWTATVFALGTAMAALASERAMRAIASGAWAREGAAAWIGGTGDAFPSVVAMLLATALFAVAIIATRGMAAPILLAELILSSATAASVVYAHALNMFSATVVAVPVWSITLIAGWCMALSAMARWTPRHALAPDTRRRAWMGLGLIVLALALRLAAAPAVTRLVQQLTVP